MKIGQILQEKYRIDAELSSKGGFGIVYRGTDLRNGKTVAVKEIKAQQVRESADADATENASEKSWEKRKEEFLEEARILKILDDVPQVVKVYDACDEGDTAYIVMEFLEGRTLKEELANGRRKSSGEAYRIICELLSILARVHQHHIIHRDIAPDNIFILPSGRLKLFDFGIAHSFGDSRDVRPWVDAKKKGYTPLEQLRKSKVQNAATDIYAAAVTYYEMLTGIRPPDSDERRTPDKIVLPTKAGAPVSPEEERVLMNALAVENRDRIRTAEEFVSLLQKTHKKKSRKSVIAIVTAAAGVALLAGAAVFMMRQTGGRSEAEISASSGTISEQQSHIELQETPVEGNEPAVMDAGHEGREIVEPSGADLAAGDRVTVPDVTGMTESEASGCLKEAGLTYSKRAESSLIVPKGEIIRQEPAAGSEAERDSSVQIYVSLGEKEQDYKEEIMTLEAKTTEAPRPTSSGNSGSGAQQNVNPVNTEPYYAEPPTISNDFG